MSPPPTITITKSRNSNTFNSLCLGDFFVSSAQRRVPYSPRQHFQFPLSGRLLCLNAYIQGKLNTFFLVFQFPLSGRLLCLFYDKNITLSNDSSIFQFPLSGRLLCLLYNAVILTETLKCFFQFPLSGRLLCLRTAFVMRFSI